MKKSIKLAFLFIGTVIGAGFATGREIALYFKNISPLAAAFSGLALGFLCTLFIIIGNINKSPVEAKFKRGENPLAPKKAARKAVEDEKILRDGGVKVAVSPLERRGAAAVFFHSAVIFAAFTQTAAMCAGADELGYAMFKIPFMGAAFSLLSVVAVLSGLEKIKLINTVLIPVMTVFIAVLFVKGGVSSIEGNISVIKPFAYAGLNIFLAGIILMKNEATKKEAAAAGIISAVVFALILFFIKNIITGREDAAMPLYLAAKEFGLSAVGGLIILLAIITTMISSLKLFSDELAWLFALFPRRAMINGNEAVFFAALAAALSSVLALLGFKNLVDYTYPVQSVFGLALLAYTVTELIRSRRGGGPLVKAKRGALRSMKKRLKTPRFM